MPLFPNACFHLWNLNGIIILCNHYMFDWKYITELYLTQWLIELWKGGYLGWQSHWVEVYGIKYIK